MKGLGDLEDVFTRGLKGLKNIGCTLTGVSFTSLMSFESFMSFWSLTWAFQFQPSFFIIAVSP
ncbi:MAG: hypothetical protein BWX80_03476 [Candidatus Hydrogenedentes bacterium ADurb.Bin101]|nr:MAG: hypothetical protein BWX80_03476 [Candidatus Hydrogenedentes bacterium ADurb.Bin101]